MNSKQSTTATTYPASDTDGYDGGWIVDDGERRAHGETALEAWRKFQDGEYESTSNE